MGAGRKHLNWSGKPKRPYTQEQALLVVARLNSQSPERDARSEVSAYECTYCEFWHVGRIGKRVFRLNNYVLYCELDDRTVSNLRSENIGSTADRLNVLAGRWRRIIREAAIK